MGRDPFADAWRCANTIQFFDVYRRRCDDGNSGHYPADYFNSAHCDRTEKGEFNGVIDDGFEERKNPLGKILKRIKSFAGRI